MVHILMSVRPVEPGGWRQEKKMLRKATVIPNEDASAEHFGEGRVSVHTASVLAAHHSSV